MTITNLSVRFSGGLAAGSDNCFYGITTQSGFPNYVTTIRRITTNGVLTSCTNWNEYSPVPGRYPRLLLASDGNFYGTTASGGISNKGTIFRVKINGDLTTLAHFTSANGSAPESPLIEGSDRNLYGTTTSSGYSPSGGGIVFRLVEKPVIVSSTLSNQTSTLTWTSFTNGIYRVEYKSSLSDTGWTPRFPNVTATNSLASISDPVGTSTQ